MVIVIEKSFKIPVLICLLCGFGSRAMIGFSPTVYGSLDRTSIFMCYSFVVVSGLFVSQIFKHISRNKLEAV